MGTNMAASPEDIVVTLIQNDNIFYVIDEMSKKVFEKDLGLPFYCFTTDEKDCVSGLMRRTKIKVKVVQSKTAIKDVVKPLLDSWIEHQPFKRPIKKKYEVSKDFTQVTFVHLGPTAKTMAQKIVAIDKCKDSIDPFLHRVWDQLEPHFYKVQMLDPQVETEKHRSGGTVIRISYPIVFVKGETDDSEDDD